MNRTKIEWVKNPDGSQGYTHNPTSGCRNHTPEGLCLDGLFPCYAYKLANGRLKQRYLANHNVSQRDTEDPILKLQIYNDPFYPRFWEERLRELQRGIDAPDYQSYIRQKPKGIFPCDMGDLFGIGVPEQWTRKVLETIGDDSNSMHRFYLLTKQAQRLPEFSPFPENCWVGVSVTRNNQLENALKYLKQIEATVKFISFEPLLEHIDMCTKIWYNPVYEDNKSTGEHSLQSGNGQRIGDRQPGEDLEDCSSQVRQMEGGEQDNSLQETKGGKQHRAIPSSPCDVQQGEILCNGSSPSLQTFPRRDSQRDDGKSSEWDKRRQPTREFGIGDSFTTDKPSNKNPQKGEMPSRSLECRSEINTESSDGNQETPCQRRESDINRTRLQCPLHNHIQNCAQENLGGISWIILGACTGTKKDMTELNSKYPHLTVMPWGKKWTAQPPIEDLREIVEAADKAGIRVFLKDNLKPLFKPDYEVEYPWAYKWGAFRQEMPIEQ